MTQPIDLTSLGDQEILITWDDEHRSIFDSKFLRLYCPCAQCVDELTGKRTMTMAKVKQDIKILDSLPVGRYGMRFLFSDQHHTGIYSFDYLRGHCPCAICEKIRQ